MSITLEEMTAWCQGIIAKSPDFPSFEDALAAVPALDSLGDIETGTPVLVRGDIDVKIKDGGAIPDDARLRSLVDTVKFLTDRGAKVILYGHMGRPPAPSVEAVGPHLSGLLGGVAVSFVADWMNPETGEILPAAGNAVEAAPNGSVILLENTRKYDLERALWKEFRDDLDANLPKITTYANGMGQLARVHVNEGFAASNADLSSVVVPRAMDRVALGEYINRELREEVTKTRLAELVIFSGIKIQKLDDLQQILARDSVRMVIAAGNLAIALLAAQAKSRGETLELGAAGDPNSGTYIPPEKIDQAAAMLAAGEEKGIEFVLPVDFVLTDKTVSTSIPAGGAQMDIGPATRELHARKTDEFIAFHNEKQSAGNGPAYAFHNGVFGKFEEDPFGEGTEAFISQLKKMNEAGVQVYVGGGEGGKALYQYGDESWVTHCFTAGGTILKALGREPIPYVKALYQAATG